MWVKGGSGGVDGGEGLRCGWRVWGCRWRGGSEVWMEGLGV